MKDSVLVFCCIIIDRLISVGAAVLPDSGDAGRGRSATGVPSARGGAPDRWRRLAVRRRRRLGAGRHLHQQLRRAADGRRVPPRRLDESVLQSTVLIRNTHAKRVRSSNPFQHKSTIPNSLTSSEMTKIPGDLSSLSLASRRRALIG